MHKNALYDFAHSQRVNNRTATIALLQNAQRSCMRTHLHISMYRSLFRRIHVVYLTDRCLCRRIQVVYLTDKCLYTRTHIVQTNLLAKSPIPLVRILCPQNILRKCVTGRFSQIPISTHPLICEVVDRTHTLPHEGCEPCVNPTPNINYVSLKNFKLSAKAAPLRFPVHEQP
jgi:hypothetical protein